MIVDTAAGRRDLIARSRSVAVVGASANPGRPSHGVFLALQASGRFATVVPVNPQLHEPIGGVEPVPDLAAYAAAFGAPDIVDVFRRAEDAPEVARAAIAAGARAIWFQEGVVNAEAIRLADEAGLDVVADRCLKVDVALSGLPRRPE